MAEVPEAPENPKGHADAELEGSMSRFGYTEPVMVDERTGRLVSGHGRKRALLALQERQQEPPDGVLVGDDGQWLIPVIRGWASRNDYEAQALLLASNRLTELGGWDDQSLANLLEQLSQESEQALEATGFTESDLDDLLAKLGDEVVLAGQDTDAAYAESPPRGEPAPPRQTQGMHDVVLVYQGQHHRDFGAAVALVKRKYETDSTPLAVLWALQQVAGLDHSQ